MMDQGHNQANFGSLSGYFQIEMVIVINGVPPDIFSPFDGLKRTTVALYWTYDKWAYNEREMHSGFPLTET